MAANRHAWSVEASCKMEQMIDTQTPWPVISAALGYTVKQCKRKWERMQWNLPQHLPEDVNRTCLGCGKPFIADGKYLRLCPTCRSNAW